MENAADLINRDIIPFYDPGGEMWIQFFAASSDPNLNEISRRLIIAKDWDEYEDMVSKVTSTGLFADMGLTPWQLNSEDELKYWYISSEKYQFHNRCHLYIVNLVIFPNLILHYASNIDTF